MFKKHLESYYLISFLFISVFAIVPFDVKPFLLLPLLLTSLISIFYSDKKKIKWKKFLISTSIYFIFLISAFYSSDTSRTINLLIRLIPFLVLPFGFAMVPYRFYNKIFKLFIKVYVVSCCLFCFLIFVYSLSLNSSELPYIYSYLSNKFWGYEDHPIYISLYLGIALILISFRKKRTHLDISMFIVILFTILFLSRKGNILSLLMILLFILMSNAKLLFRKKAGVYILIGATLVVLVSYLFDNYLFIRFYEGFNLSKSFNQTESSTGIRSILWRVCLNLSYESPFFGYGLGDVQTNINSRLIENGYEELTTIHIYNAHNQYLQIVLSTGYLGLLFFLGILSYFLRIFNNRNDKLALCVFLYIIFCFIFESILERQNGIIITALFFNLFLFLPKEKKTQYL